MWVFGKPIGGYSFLVASSTWKGSNYRVNLARRRVIPNEEAAVCLGCIGALELDNHLFVSCPLAWEVWGMVHRWFGLTTVLPETMSSLFESFVIPFRKGKQDYK
ncbi:hypothetical protein L195_g000166 [Trifolium pratense]|uniref:Reverse transcriptase zinc-binding domain-containing protein n=1 Tax=Trifolium pratense TaxID=57577 RepID=A0A2K3NL38_TRIPR|nr:hypothetical protein L195_g000166 [Trifolium pratense]